MDAEEFLGVAKVMKRIRHPNLVQLLGVCTSEHPFFIIMEFMPKGNLLNYLQSSKKMECATLVHVAQQVVSAMSYLESKSIVHRYHFD